MLATQETQTIRDEHRAIGSSERLLPSRSEYAAVMADVHDILGLSDDPDLEESTFGRDFFRVQRRDPMMLNPEPVDPLSLSDKEFEGVARRFGPDMYRVRVIPRSLVDMSPELSVLPAGGSCAIETWGLRMVNFLKSQQEADPAHEQERAQGHKQKGQVDDSDIAQLATRLIELGPTVSHVSGAILSGAGADNVHYVESGLWTQTAKALGVEAADERVRQLYARINQAVARRASLINSETRMHFIDFNELDLENAVRELSSEMGIDHDPTFGTAQVLYTYIGPDLLARVHSAIERRAATGNGQSLQGDYHVIGRFKQVDHNTWDSMDLPYDVISGHRDTTFDEDVRAAESYPFRAGIALGKYVVRTEGDIHSRNSVVAGFMDTPLGGELMHMRPNQRGADRLSGNLDREGIQQRIERILNDPRRLHHGNFEEHMAYLELLMSDQVPEIRQRLVARNQEISATLKPLLNRKAHLEGIVQKTSTTVEQVQRRGVEAERLAVYIAAVSSGSDEITLNAEEREAGMLALLRRMSTLWKPIDDRVQSGEPLTELDEADVMELDNLLSGIMQHVGENVDQYRPLLATYSDRLDRALETTREQRDATQVEIAELHGDTKDGVLTERAKGKIESKTRLLHMKDAEISELTATRGFVQAANSETASTVTRAELLRGLHGLTERIISATDDHAKQAFRSTVARGLREAAPQSQRLLQQFVAEAEFLQADGIKRIATLESDAVIAEQERVTLEAEIHPLKQEHERISLQLTDIPKPFPLEENLMVSHALQFLWDADVRMFVHDARIIKNSELSKGEKDSAMREAMRRIYPKIHAYYAYIFGRTDERPV